MRVRWRGRCSAFCFCFCFCFSKETVVSSAIRNAVFVLVSVLLASEVYAGDPPPLVWRHTISDRLEKSRIQQYGVGPYADAQSRLETELQATIPLTELAKAKKKVDRLVRSPAAAAKVFGKGYRVVRLNKTPRRVADIYMDTPDGKLASVGASLRIRIENGIAQVNFKPPGGQRFPSGMAHRIENGIAIQFDKGKKMSARTVAFLENTRLRDNPLRELPRLFPGMKARDFLIPQLQIKQKRAIYEVQKLEGGAWVTAGEITIDKVNSTKPGGKGKRVSFGRVELEGEHLSLQLTQNQKARLKAAKKWKGPHKASDTRNPAFTKSKDVKNIDRMGLAFSKFLGVTKADGSKYAEARRLLKAKGVNISRRAKVFRASRRSTKARTAAKAKARTRVASRRKR